MFNKIIVSTLSILWCASALFADGREEIESMCTEKWGSNHQMRAECIENQLSAAEFWITHYFNKYVTAHIAAVDKDPDSTYLEDEAVIVYECSKNFKDAAGRYDYQMVLDCCVEQFRALNASK
jgi:hypothetical protein